MSNATYLIWYHAFYVLLFMARIIMIVATSFATVKNKHMLDKYLLDKWFPHEICRRRQPAAAAAAAIPAAGARDCSTPRSQHPKISH